jgi:hypothetical protein
MQMTNSLFESRLAANQCEAQIKHCAAQREARPLSVDTCVDRQFINATIHNQSKELTHDTVAIFFQKSNQNPSESQKPRVFCFTKPSWK